jgi:ribonuclease Z
MKFEITILGSSSATPIYNRNPSSQLLNVNDRLFLIDCGEATQQQMLRFGIKAQKIEHIFISHLHGDHYLGLIGLLSSLHLNGRIKPIHIYAPAELLEILNVQFKYSETELRYSIEFHPTHTEKSELIFENQDVSVETIVLSHRIPCTGFKFTGKKRLPKIIKEKVDELQISVDHIKLIKKGFDFTDKQGKIHTADELTTAADEPKVYAYCSDTVCNWTYIDQIKNIDLLYHEATFLHEMLERAQETFHTTAQQAGEIASKANVKRLLIGHFSARYRDLQPLLDESKSIFANTELAIEGMTFEV